MKKNENKWQVNRAGLFNYWYYEDQAFEFAGGKLLLRGNNGAGKSVTMQSFLPVLLDGSTRPERLDPFNSRSRRMEDYLLGEKEVSGIDERTGYLYMEFKKQETEQYVTIGIGLHARRGKPLNFWGFVINDNRRIGHDFFLYKGDKQENKQVKIPLSKIQLRNQMENGGYVVDTRRDYASLVNQYVFGYDTIEEYEDLIKLLIQLRSPKLSKEFRPSVIFEILEEALPPLSDEDLRYLSDTIEQMDQTKQQLEQTERESEAISQITRAYTAYNNKVLYEQAEGYRDALGTLNKEKKALGTIAEEEKKLKIRIDTLKDTIEEKELDKEAAENQRKRLEQLKIWDMEEERKKNHDALKNMTKRINETETRLSGERKKESLARHSLNQTEKKIQDLQKRIQDILAELDSDADEASFEDIHTVHLTDYLENSKGIFQFEAWHAQVNQHIGHLEEIAEELREYDALRQRSADKEKELGYLKQQVDESRNEEEDWETWFEEEKDRQLNAVHEWIRSADYLHLSDETINTISRSLNRLFEETRYEHVREPVRTAVSDYEMTQRGKVAELKIEQERIQKHSDELKIELIEWKNKRDPDPNTHPQTKEARAKIEELGVGFVPFYSAVEFRENVSEEKQKRLEAALIDSGLLDALITDREITVEHDRILKPDPHIMAYTLADLLKPDLNNTSSVSEERVDQVLRSIVIDDTGEQNLSISEDGRYSVGLMEGHAISVDSVRFIGRNARERYRKEQIALLQDEWMNEQKLIDELSKQKRQLTATITYAKEQFGNFPGDEDLSEGYKNLEKVRLELKQLNSHVHRVSEEFKEIIRILRSLKASLDQKTVNNGLNLEVSAYLEALKSMRLYDKSISELKREHGQLLNEYQRNKEIRGRLDDLEEVLLLYKGDLNSYQSDSKRLNKEIEHIEAQMKKEGLDDVRKQVEDVQQTLKELNQSLEEKRDERSKKVTELDYTKKAFDEKEQQLLFWNKLKLAWEKTFDEESRRRLSSYLSADSNLENRAKEIIDELEKDAGQEKNQLLSRVSRVRNDQQDYLMEYRPLQRTVYSEVPEWMDTIESTTNQIYIEKWKSARSRDLVELRQQEKSVSPYAVEKDLKEEKERQKIYLDKQDKQLYEEILFQSVGNKLRARIGRAERWVEEMKALMESRNDSSGLIFSIRWKPRTAETEDEMDTEDLVDLLRRDSRLLNDEDIEQVTNHFRTKIERAKALMNESTELQTLLQVLKQVLDYRHWFSFELTYRRSGDERKRLLTDNQFYKFSGGEKARAMYIPLFIATYSRYQEAKNDAPYIISLDEAFAGVDDRNIADLFEVMEELNFNYIINSQGLWGDYATVSELAVSELFRPQNADHVAVIRYLWDGNRRTLVTSEEG